MSDRWAARGSCPRCGGGLELEVGDPVIKCGYCRTNVYATARGPLRYKLEAADPERAERAQKDPDFEFFYLPYWRIRGIRYHVNSDPPKIEQGYLNGSLPASEFVPAAATLGVRSQAARITLTSEDSNVLAADVAAENSAVTLERLSLGTEEPEHLFSRLIGDTRCLLHAPFELEHHKGGYILRALVKDGRNHRISPQTAVRLLEHKHAARLFKKMDFLPLMCPECGSDLDASPGAVAMVCDHCTRAWWTRGERFERMPYGISRLEKDSRYFPFWQIVFRADGLPLFTRGDLVKWSAPYRKLFEGWDKQPLQALIPGFKAGPRQFMRLAKGISILSPVKMDPDAKPSYDLDFEPVRLPLPEAAQALKVFLSFTALNKKSYSQVANAKLRVQRARLVFLPFRRKGAEWIEEESGQAIQDASIRHGRRM